MWKHLLEKTLRMMTTGGLLGITLTIEIADKILGKNHMHVLNAIKLAISIMNVRREERIL